jgi:hypothetical protein
MTFFARLFDLTWNVIIWLMETFQDDIDSVRQCLWNEILD